MKNKLIKALLATIILSGSLNALAADWRQYDQDHEGTLALYNADNIFTKNGKKGVQIMFDYRPSGGVWTIDNGVQFNQISFVVYFNCAKKQMNLGPSIAYMNTELVDKKDGTLDWKKVERNSSDERLMNIVCKKK